MATVTASVSLSAIRAPGASWVVEQRSRMTRIERSEISSCLLWDVSWPCPPYEGIMLVPPPALWQPEPTQTQQFPWPGDTSVVSYCTQPRQGEKLVSRRGIRRILNVDSNNIFKYQNLCLSWPCFYSKNIKFSNGHMIDFPEIIWRYLKWNSAKSETLESGTGFMAWIFCKYSTLETLSVLSVV